MAEDEIDLNLNLDGTQIQNTKQEKLLSVIIDNTLTWHNQIKKVKQTIAFKLSILGKIGHYLPTTMRMLYHNYYIKPHLEYCCTIWGQCSKTDTYSIVKLQKTIKPHALFWMLICIPHLILCSNSFNGKLLIRLLKKNKPQ